MLNICLYDLTKTTYLFRLCRITFATFPNCGSCTLIYYIARDKTIYYTLRWVLSSVIKPNATCNVYLFFSDCDP